MRAVLFSMLVAIAIGGAVTWFMTRSYGGGDEVAAQTACVSVNQYARAIGYDPKKEPLNAPPPRSGPTPTPGLAELLKGARTRGGGGVAELKRLEAWCIGRGYGPTPTPEPCAQTGAGVDQTADCQRP